VIERIDSAADPPGEEPDDMTARLVQLAGVRPAVEPAREARVRRAFVDEVRSVARSRSRRRRALIAAGVLATAAGLVLAIRIAPPVTPGVAPALGAIERAEGAAGIDGASGTHTVVAVAQVLRRGDTVATASGRVAFRLGHNVSVRVDHASRVRLADGRALELTRGAVYIDNGSAGAPLEVRTPLGTIRDIGTQFEVRLTDDAVRVRVRSGHVEIRRGTDVAAAHPGMELAVETGGISSRPAPIHGPDWAWTAELAPPLDIDGQTLDAFLRQLCREEGWTLAYSEPSLARDAPKMILRGSSGGLEPPDALAVALATTGLTHTLDDGVLRVARAAR
jgi:ferric-dicitrate binding protein FerR (iron transport regulator)